ncbi:MAG: hypothetical protein GX136_06400 [Clostridiales bacterium]|nr:hypothetical protein [Clostridiales bacterium]
MDHKVAILGAQNPPNLRSLVKAMIEESGFCADLLKSETRNLSDMISELEGYSALITCGEKIPGVVFRSLAPKGLKLVSRCGIGTDEMDIAAATESGVAVCNAAGSLSTTVAECAMALILNVLRDFPNADAEVRKGDWSRFFQGKCTRQLEGKTVGLIGFGDISKALAKMLYGFDCRILAFDINFDKNTAERYGVIESDIQTIQREADIISLHVPAVKGTIGMVDMAFLKKMKRAAILINTGRGKLVNEPDLIEALKTGVIAGAGLDVFAQEPLPADSPLIGLKNVMLLPHNASSTIEAVTRANEYSAKNVIDFLSGNTVATILNPDYVNYL